MGAKVSSGKKELSEKDLAYFTQHTGLQKEQVLSKISCWSNVLSIGKYTLEDEQKTRLFKSS